MNPTTTPDPRHSVGRLLAVMERYGSITPEMRKAGLEMRAVLAKGARVRLAELGTSAASCIAVLCHDRVEHRLHADQGRAARASRIFFSAVSENIWCFDPPKANTCRH